MLRRCWGLAGRNSWHSIQTIPLRSCASTEAEVVTDVKQPSISPDLALPKFVFGRWRQPKLSNRQINVIRKQYRERGEEWIDPRPWKIGQGRRPYPELQDCKGHKWDKAKEAKEKKIQENLKKMPEMIRKYHREERERKIKTYDEEHWLYPYEIKRIQRKKIKKKKASVDSDDDYDVYTQEDKEANDDHKM